MNGGIPRLTYRQYRAVQRLVHNCCNYDGGSCLALDNGWDSCVCVQSISSSLSCKWFRSSVLPQDDSLYAALLHRDRMKHCVLCGNPFVPNSNRGKYCRDCAATVRRKKETARQRRRYYNSTHLEG